MKIKNLFIGSLLISLSCIASANFFGNEEWYALNDKEIRILSNIDSNLAARIFSVDPSGGSKDKAFVLMQGIFGNCEEGSPPKEIYVTVNGDTTLWKAACYNENNYNKSYVYMPRTKKYHEKIISMFLGNNPVKLKVALSDFTIPTKGFNKAYKLLK